MSRRVRKRMLIWLAVLALTCVAVVLSPFGRGVRDLWNHGVGSILIPPKRERRVSGDSASNLARIRTALLLYERSEEAFPTGPGWNEAVKKRLSASDLLPGEEARVLTRPGAARGGYALNAAASGKYRGDLPPTTILVYETARAAPDAVGDPKSDALPGGRGISISGELVTLR